MAAAAHFEIRRAKIAGEHEQHETGWMAAFVAANGETVWTTETYHRRDAALNAIALLKSETYLARVELDPDDA